MEDYCDVDAHYELRTHLEDEAAVGYEEWVTWQQPRELETASECSAAKLTFWRMML